MNNIKFKQIINTDNKKKVIKYLLKVGSSSRVELAKEISVTTASLSKISKQLIESGIIEESGEITEGKIGRKQIEINLSKNSFFSIGIDISTNFSRIIVLDLALNIVMEKTWKYSKLSQENLDILIEELKYIISKFDKEYILGAGLLMQGIIRDSQSLTFPIKDIKEQIEQKIDLSVLVLNNIKGLAITENLLSEYNDNYLLVKYGPGIGGVISVHGKVIEGLRNRAGEIGHIKWNENSKRKCPICGKYGCLESEIHLNRIFEKKYHTIIKSPDEINKSFINDNRKQLNNFINELSKAISLSIDIIDPEKLLIAGSIFDDDKIYKLLVKLICKRTEHYNQSDIIKIKKYDKKIEIAPAVIVISNYLYVEDTMVD